MTLYLIVTLLFVGLSNLVLALPATSVDLTVPHPTHPDEHASDALNINGTEALESGAIRRDPARGWCNLSIGLVEHFPRGGVMGGRRASIYVGGMWDNDAKKINWGWDNGTPPKTNGRPTERRIDYGPIRIFDLISPGDSLTFSWYHPDINDPEKEWIDFDFNNNKWNDRDKDCSKRHCCITGKFYGDGENRMLRGIGCGFSCP